MIEQERLPLYDRLRLQRETTLVGLRAAELSGSVERITWYQEALERVERRIAEIRTPIGGDGRGAEIRALRRAYAAKQVTPREFGQRMRRLLK